MQGGQEMEIGKKLKHARLQAKLTQEQVAELIHVSRQTISNWENEKSYPDILSVIRLSDVYQISLDVLLKGDPDLMKHLNESTDIVKSNKKVILGYILWGVFYIGLLMVDRAYGIVKISDPLLNYAVLGLFIIGITWYLIRHVKVVERISKLDRRKVISTGLFGVLFVAALFIVFPFIDRMTDSPWLVTGVRIAAILVTGSIMFKGYRTMAK